MPVLEKDAAPATEAPKWSRGRAPAYRLIPWMLPVVAAVAGLLSVEVPLEATVRYAAYFGACVVLPGVLLLRALWRSTGNWGEDAGLGAAVGAACQLVGWGIFTALGLQSWLVAWPLLILVAFAAVPALRRHWRISDPEPLPLVWHGGLAVAATVLVLATTLGVMAFHLAPPAGRAYYPDLLYHLSMVHELVRSVPPQLPQAAGESLDYHWLPNADMAAAVDITRLSPAIVLYRLWLVPMVVVALLVCAALARSVSKAWWTGLVPAVVLAGPQVVFLRRRNLDLAPPLSFLSPSQTFGLIAVTAAAVFFIQLLFRGGTSKGIWVLAVAVALVGGGSKPTVLPVLVGAVGLSALFLLVRDRELPRRAIAAGALLLASVVGTMVLVAGSTSGSGFQLLAIVKLSAGYRAATGDTTPGAEGGWILPALTSGTPLTVIGVLAVLGLVLIGQLVSVAGFGLLVLRKTRRDPIAWFLVGALTAGWAGYLIVDHPAASEAYFIRTAVPFGAAAVGWLMAVSVRGFSRRLVAVTAGGGLALGVVFGVVLVTARLTPAGDQLERVWAVARPLVAATALAALLGLAWWLVVRRRFAVRGLGVALAALAVVTIPTAMTVGRTVTQPDQRKPGVYGNAVWRYSADEVVAAGWLRANSRPADVVAGNTYCRRSRSRPADCDARGYLISGIAGRRTLIEGWAYTQQAMADHGVNGKRYSMQPSPWPDRVELTSQAIGAPTAEAMTRLRDQYGVRWIFADPTQGEVSPRLGEFATLRHATPTVRVYELRS